MFRIIKYFVVFYFRNSAISTVNISLTNYIYKVQILFKCFLNFTGIGLDISF